MDSDLIELCSTARALDLAARAAPRDWPPLARELAKLCVGLSGNASAVLALVKRQDALIQTLRADVERASSEITALRTAIQAEHKN